MKLLIRIVTFCLAVCSTTAAAELRKSIIVSSDFERNINTETFYFVDNTNTFTIATIRERLNELIPVPGPNIALDLATSTAWILLPLDNPTNDQITLAIEFNPVFLEDIKLYDEKNVLVDQTGSIIPGQPLHSFPVLNFNAPPGKSQFLVSIKSRSNTISMILRSEKIYNDKQNFDLATFFLLIGSLLGLGVYHLFMYLTYRRRVYILYFFVLTSVAFFTVSFTSYHHWLPLQIGKLDVGFWWSALAAPVMLSCIYYFSMHLLDEKGNIRGRIGSYAFRILPVWNAANLITAVATNSAIVLASIRLSALIHMLVLPGFGILIWLRNRKDKIALYYSLSWSPFAAGGVAIVLWLSGFLAQHAIYPWAVPIGSILQSILLSFAAGQRLNILTQEIIEEQGAKLQVMEKLKENLENLKKRDNVISSFVSPKILEELENGSDPVEYSPRYKRQNIVFIDMRGFTTFAETYNDFECFDILNGYFNQINKAIFDGGGQVDKIIGDSVMSVFEDEKKCLQATIEIRRRISQINSARVKAGEMPYKFGTGIAHGLMLAGNFGTIQKLDRTVVGDTVNIASRIEGLTKEFAVDILCSKEFYELHPDYEYMRPAGYVSLKGRKKKVLVYEIFEHNKTSVIEWKIASRKLIWEVVELELNGKYRESLSILYEMISRCPPHGYINEEIMDPTLKAMASAIETKVKQLGIKL